MRFFPAAFLFSSLLASAQTHRVKVELIGDSTQTDNAGYGRGFCANLTSAVDCVNLAKGGSSTMAFRRDGLWDKGLASQPDYMLIQFGHNDMVTPEHADRQVPLEEYKQNLRNFVLEAREHGIYPVLITPITRRYFGSDGKIHSDLTAYSDALKSVASDLHTPLLDLQAESIAYLNKLGEVESTKLGITKKDSSGKTIPDKTHLNWRGSYLFGRIVAVDLGKAVPELAQYIRPTAAALPAEGQLAMRVLQQQPFAIDLVTADKNFAATFAATLASDVTLLTDAPQSAWPALRSRKAQYYILPADEDNLTELIASIRALDAIPVLYALPETPKQSVDTAHTLAAETKTTFIMVSRAGSGISSGRAFADNLIRTQVELGPNVIGLPAARAASPQQAAPTDGK